MALPFSTKTPVNIGIEYNKVQYLCSDISATPFTCTPSTDNSSAEISFDCTGDNDIARCVHKFTSKVVAKTPAQITLNSWPDTQPNLISISGKQFKCTPNKDGEVICTPNNIGPAQTQCTLTGTSLECEGTYDFTLAPVNTFTVTEITRPAEYASIPLAGLKPASDARWFLWAFIIFLVLLIWIMIYRHNKRRP